MYEIGLSLAGIIAGGVVAWVVASARARAGRAVAEELRGQLQGSRDEVAKLQAELRAAAADRAAAEARAGAVQASLEEQKALLVDAKGRLTDAFKALAADVLKSSNEDFLALAKERFAALQQGAAGELEARRTAIEAIVQPLQKALGEYQQEARALEEKRLREISSVGQQLQDVARETANLSNALRQPQIRGRWGEIALRKTAELAGMTRYCDFVEQETVATEEGRLRPDMVVRLPAKREIVVDSKVALNAYLDALEAKTPEAREAALARHAQQVKTHVRQLASKEYWNQFTEAPEFVVLFIPGDPFWAAAAERDPELLQDALANHVLIATPTTFIGLLLTAAYGWRQEQIAENAQRISELGREVHDRLATLVDHFLKVGKSLKGAVEAYDRAVGSLESRVLPAARRFPELGTGAGKEIERLDPVAQVPRSLAAGDGAEAES